MCRSRAWSGVVLACSFFLGSCASPCFIHDPRTLVVDREEVPRLLRSLRCELITYIAANNQRNMMFQAEAKLHGIHSAIERYSYYEIDWTGFGALQLTLQIQDSLGLQSGTQFDWMRTNDGGAHAHAWNLGPTASDQSTYAATWSFAVPQDAISVRPARRHASGEEPFSCYSEIPRRNPAPFNSPYTVEDLDALARNDFPDYALFKRILVNNTMPLAGWLEEVGIQTSDPTLHGNEPAEAKEQIVPAQMAYQFEVIVSGGLDVKYSLTSPLWPTVGPEVAGNVQKTNTIAIVLNGIDLA